jgi:hypothetical protein
MPAEQLVGRQWLRVVGGRVEHHFDDVRGQRGLACRARSKATLAVLYCQPTAETALPPVLTPMHVGFGV